MPSFRYEALDGSGRRLTGLMEGASRGEVIQELNRSGFLPIKATEARAQSGRSWRDMLTPEPKSEDITAMTLDIVMLLKGGVTLSEALVLLQQMGGSRWRVRVLHELHLAISVGKTFSAALAEHPRLFSPIYVKMVEVAEATGRLEEALESLAEERQRMERMKKRLVGAIAYPAFLVVSALSAMTFIFLYVIPQFETALEGYRDKIDPTALMVFNMSAFLRANIQTITVGLAAVILGGLLLGQLGAKRGFWVPLLAKLPFFRTLFLYEATLKFCRTLAVLIGNGVDISTALRLLRDVVRLPTFAAGIDGVIADVRKGRRLSEALDTRDILPKHVVQMLRVGEESGRLPDSASRVATFYEARLDTALTRVIAVIGPVTMVLVSVLIAWLIISVMTALMSVNDLLK
jgi:general secretion pathway protein F